MPLGLGIKITKIGFATSNEASPETNFFVKTPTSGFVFQPDGVSKLKLP
jgi:hypothetical protein